MATNNCGYNVTRTTCVMCSLTYLDTCPVVKSCGVTEANECVSCVGKAATDCKVIYGCLVNGLNCDPDPCTQESGLQCLKTNGCGKASGTRCLSCSNLETAACMISGCKLNGAGTLCVYDSCANYSGTPADCTPAKGCNT
jgi:hypothetical protein